MMNISDDDVVSLFRGLMSVNDVGKIKSTLEYYKGEDSKYFKTLITNLEDDLAKYKYVFDLVLKIMKENPKTKFHDIYFKYLSTNNFLRYKNFFLFLNKVVLDDNIESLIYEDEDNDSHYNSIISSMDLPVGLKLIKDFLTQRGLNFEEYYYQKYLSNTEKLVNTLENTLDVNELYYRYPWFNNAITSKVYIASTNHDIDVFISNLNSPIVHKNKSWYKPNNLFYSYCSNQRNNRVLKGSHDDNIATLEFLDEKGKVLYSFHILYKLFKNDFTFHNLILDDSIYTMEKKFFTVDYDTCCDEYHVNMFMDDDAMYSQANIDLVLEFFNKTMVNVQSEYKMNSSVLKLPALKNIRTLRELARRVAEITVFLHIDFISHSTFKKQIIRNYYKQNALFDLTFEEKLPELLYDTEHSDVITEYLLSSIESEIFNIGESVYRLSRKSMFKPLQKKKTHHPPIHLKYIDENDNHNYIRYKEKWLNIKDVLSKRIYDDEYITDVIYPRMSEIYNYENVMMKSISKKEFESKYNLLFSLLEDVMSKDEIYDKHKDLFLYYPDPTYDDGDEVDGVIIEEIKPIVVPEKVKPTVISVESAPVKMTPDIVTVPAPVEMKAPEIITEEAPPPLEVIPISKKASDICSNCGVNSYHQNTTTFIHKNSDPKSVRCITICYNCLEKNTLTDD